MLMVVPKNNSNTQQTDFGLRVVKTNDNTKSRARAKMNPRCIMYDYAKGCHWGKWLACSRQTLV